MNKETLITELRKTRKRLRTTLKLVEDYEAELEDDEGDEDDRDVGMPPPDSKKDKSVRIVLKRDNYDAPEFPNAKKYPGAASVARVLQQARGGFLSAERVRRLVKSTNEINGEVYTFETLMKEVEKCGCFELIPCKTFYKKGGYYEDIMNSSYTNMNSSYTK